MNIRYIVYSVVCLLILSSCSGNQPTGKEVAPFSFIDQNEKPFGTDDLNGTVWIASFVFSNCETVCPPMMFEMASLQKEIEEKKLQEQRLMKNEIKKRLKKEKRLRRISMKRRIKKE